eukprot:Gregarina_sp_Poly_1__4504@NODE_241_length_10879_cov_245_316038_g212_i0_p1_GENE_NODE_241_length_10879_cov_245_316038_g212_i0NODE_241_length_10879_cov_245_316038_g212_i0_p1_ORF_typecomplete_len2605_score474_06KAP/PF05804_12/21KAP/PF05804_12/3_4KAP/PF05804_12/2_7e03KAP/PF05804_12/1KAP/PF05804_12/2_5e06DUF3361/PF11841_8/3_4e02DUF3361/PF11841_8/1_4e03DUF3361/PF11841_8/1_2e04DUF3361/PF11841_8/4_8e03DUF3361/PF11841_8/4_8e02DUF3361/PF11841_8/6_4e03DUF3361/PF11841_8/2_2e06Arm_2/PF04826_13/5_3Arm_2/PF0482
MPRSSLRRAPGAEVISAVQAISTKVTFKSAYFFSIQSLYSICDPTSGFFGQNAIAALNLGAVTKLSPALEKFVDDDQIPKCILRIYKSITYQLLQDGAPEELDRFILDGGYDSTLSWIQQVNSSHCEPTVLQTALEVIQDLQELGAHIDTAQLAPSLVSKISPKLPAAIIAKILEVAVPAMETADGVDAVGKVGGTTSLLSYLAAAHTVKGITTNTLHDQLKSGLDCVHKLISAGHWNKTEVNTVLLLADLYKDTPGVKERVMRVLDEVFTADQLKQCLETIKREPEGSAKALEALKMLGPMSYVTHFAETVVQAEGIGLLVEAVEKLSATVEKGKTEPEVVQALNGACKMLGNLAANPSYQLNVMDSGALQTATEACRALTKYPEAVAGCCSLIGPLVRHSSAGEQFLSAQGLENILICVQAHPSHQELLLEYARVLNELGLSQEFCRYVEDTNAFATLGTIVSADNKSNVLCTVVDAYTRIFQGLTSVATIAEKDVVEVLDRVLTKHKDDKPLTMSVCQAVVATSEISNAKSELATGNASSVLLKCLATTEPGTELYTLSVKGLVCVGTESDVLRVKADCLDHLRHASSKPDQAVAELVKLGGLARCPPLHHAFIQHDVANTLMTTAKHALEGNAFLGRSMLIKAALSVVAGIDKSGAQSVAPSTRHILQFAQLDSVKMEAAKDAESTLLLDILSVAQELTNTGRFQQDEIPGVVEMIISTMKKYPEHRKANVVCLQMLTDIARLPKMGASKTMARMAVPQLVIANARRVRMFEDIQVAAFECLDSMLAKDDDDMAQLMRTCGGIDAVRGAQAAHAKSTQLKKPLNSVASKLMPAGFIEDQMKDWVKNLKKACDLGDTKRQLEFLKDISAQTMVPEGARIANKLAIAGLLVAMCDALPHIADPDIRAAQQMALAQISKNTTRTLIGAKSAARNQMPVSLIRMLEDCAESPESNKETILNILAAITAMESVSLENKDIPFQLGKTLINISQAFPGDYNVSAAIAYVYMEGNSETLVNDSHFLSFMSQQRELLKSPDAKTVEAASNALAILAENKAYAKVLVANDVRNIAYDALGRLQLSPEGAPALSLLNFLSREMLSMKNLSPDRLANEVNLYSRLITESKDPRKIIALMELTKQAVFMMKDKSALSTNTGFFAAMKKAGAECADIQQVQDAVSSTLGQLGADDMVRALIAQTIEVSEAKPDRYEAQLETLTDELGLYLGAQLSEPRAITQQTNPLIRSLMASTKAASTLGTNVLRIATGLAMLAVKESQLQDDFHYRAKVMNDLTLLLPYMSQAITDTQDPKKVVKAAAKVTLGFELLTHLVTESSTRDAVLSAIQHDLLAAKAWQVVDESSDPRAIEAAQKFLTAVAASGNRGADLVEVQHLSSKLTLETLTDDVMEAVLKSQPRVGLRSIALLSAFISNGRGMANLHKNASLMSALDSIGDQSPAAAAAVAALLSKNTEKFGGNILDAIKKNVDKIKSAIELGDMTPEEEAMLRDEIMNIYDAAARDEQMRNVLKLAGFFDASNLLLASKMNDAQIKASALKLKNLGVADEELAIKMSRQLLPAMFKAAATSEDSAVIVKLLDALEGMFVHQGVAYSAAHQTGFQEFSDRVEEFLAAGFDITVAAEKIKNLVEQDEPVTLTLQKVNAIWVKEQELGASMVIAENPKVAQDIDFVFEYTDMYCQTMVNDAESEIGRELQAGCLCFSLLHSEPANTETCVAREQEILLMRGMKMQRNQHAVQWIVDACKTASRYDLAAKQFSLVTRFKETLLQVISDGREVTETQRDAWMCARLEFFKLTCMERKFYNGTNAFGTLCEVWNDCDAQRFTIETQIWAFRGMRAIVNPHWLQIILEQTVPQRLAAIIKDPTSEIRMMPDVFFLTGSLSSIPQLKMMLGDLGVVEETVRFIEREKGNMGSQARNVYPAITNALLSLGNLCVADVSNTKRFADVKGLETSVEMMRVSMEGRTEYDVANAASVVLCNVSFRRDDMKEAYGKLKAPKAVMDTISRYDGRRSEEAFRCLSSMFKAIGNLSLYTPNVREFLDGGINVTLQRFFEQSAQMPDSLIETACRSLTNLVMENDETFMQQFGIVLDPFMECLSLRQTNSSNDMFTYALTALGALSRHPDNAKTVMDRNCVSVICTIVQGNTDRSVLSAAIGALNFMALHSELIPAIRKQGGMGMIKEVLQEEVSSEEPSTEVCTNALLYLRRLMADSRSADKFAAEDGFTVLIQLLRRTTLSVSIQLEGYRCIFAMLSLHPPPPSRPATEEDDDWDGEVPSEGFMPLVLQIKRPMPPRAWESAGLKPETVGQLITLICQALSYDSCHKQYKFIRCALALLDYFAHEKVKKTVENFYRGNFFTAVVPLFDHWSSDPVIIRMIVEIAANVAYVSEEDSYETLQKADEFLRALSRTEKSLPRSAKLEARLINDVYAYLLGKYPQKTFGQLAAWDFNIEISDWSKDKYPNGVQDLPFEIKDYLRTGGKLTLITETNLSGEDCLWRGSQDLLRFQWNPGRVPQAGNYSNAIGIGRARNITLGLQSALLATAHRQRRLSVTDSNTFTIHGPATEDSPMGLELCFRANSRKERDKLVDALKEWHEAAQYGF